jgi:hypothetical protein
MTIFQWLADLGGLFDAIMLIVQLFLLVLPLDLFTSSVINGLFFLDPDDGQSKSKRKRKPAM